MSGPCRDFLFPAATFASSPRADLQPLCAHAIARPARQASLSRTQPPAPKPQPSGLTREEIRQIVIETIG